MGKGRSPKERVSRHRVETPQTIAERRCTALDALALRDEAFAHNREGIFVIHCEHGLHRSPAYAFGMIMKQRADRIVMDHFEKADGEQKNFALDMTRLVNSTFRDFWMTFGKPRQDESDPAAMRPYLKIIRVFKKVTAELYSDIQPAMPRPYRQNQVNAKIEKFRDACRCE